MPARGRPPGLGPARLNADAGRGTVLLAFASRIEQLAVPPGTEAIVAGPGIASPTALRERLARGDITGIVSLGTAGALHPGLRPGTLLLPATVIRAGAPAARVDATWHRRVHAALAGTGVDSGALLSVDAPVTTPARRALLGRESGARSVDMESAALLEIAAQHRCPALVLRAVCDAADRPLPGFAIAAVGSLELQPGAALVSALARPGEWAAAVWLAVSFLRARRALRQALRAAAPAVAAPPPLLTSPDGRSPAPTGHTR